jgi:hypothetical protein
MTIRGRRGDDNVIRIPRVIETGPYSAVEIWPPDESGIQETHFISYARPERPLKPAGQEETPRTVRPTVHSVIWMLARRIAGAFLRVAWPSGRAAPSRQGNEGPDEFRQ